MTWMIWGSHHFRKPPYHLKGIQPQQIPIEIETWTNPQNRRQSLRDYTGGQLIVCYCRDEWTYDSLQDIELN